MNLEILSLSIITHIFSGSIIITLMISISMWRNTINIFRMQVYEYVKESFKSFKWINHFFPFIKIIPDNLFQLLTLHIHTSNIINIFQFFKKIILMVHMCIYVGCGGGCVCTHVHMCHHSTHAIAHSWRPENNFQALVLSLHLVAGSLLLCYVL